MISDNEKEDDSEDNFVTESPKTNHDLCPEAILAFPKSPNASNATTAVRCLLDPCCTGVVATNIFAAQLLKQGYEIKNGPVSTWNSSNGDFVTNKQISIKKAMLPSLNKTRTFPLDISVMPHDNCSYDVIIGQQVMRDLNLDISIIKNEFTWKDLTIPFVSRGYWTTKASLTSVSLISPRRTVKQFLLMKKFKSWGRVHSLMTYSSLHQPSKQ